MDLLIHHLHESYSSPAAERPVQIVVKSPFMAMRYPKDIHTVSSISLFFKITVVYIFSCQKRITLILSEKDLKN